MAAPKIHLDQVGKTFKSPAGSELEALSETTLDIMDREFVAIVGPSGCGKSTLLNILAALIEPSFGTILIDGKVEQDRGKHFAYMFQKDLLFPWRSILDNVALSLEVAGQSRTEARRRAGAMLERFGLERFAAHYPTQLSGGMRQRAALMRTLLCDRSVLLLDEPFASLDALTRSVMQEWLLQLWEQDHRTILFITHDVEEAIFLSDRVLVMSARPGRVKFELPIVLPRPRDHRILTTGQFLELKRVIVDQIYEEAVRTIREDSCEASDK